MMELRLAPGLPGLGKLLLRRKSIETWNRGTDSTLGDEFVLQSTHGNSHVPLEIRVQSLFFESLQIMDQAAKVLASIESLRKLDDSFASMETEMKRRILALREEYKSKFDAILADRAQELRKSDSTDAEAHATPAIPGFWLDVLANSEEFNEDIEEYDEEVLEYLESIEAADIDPSDEDKGFILTFKFNENPFFTNSSLSKIYTTAKVNEWTDQLEIVKIESDKINWKNGKDVTVETVTKKRSGGGKKKKAGGVTVQPRPSFFRYFRDLDQDNLPSDFGEEDEEYEDEEEDELERLQMVMEHDWDRANTLKELIIPRAICWYTGEAVQAPEYDEDEEEEDEDEEEEDESPLSNEGGAKNLFPAGANKNEECKQQ